MATPTVCIGRTCTSLMLLHIIFALVFTIQFPHVYTAILDRNISPKNNHFQVFEIDQPNDNEISNGIDASPLPSSASQFSEENRLITSKYKDNEERDNDITSSSTVEDRSSITLDKSSSCNLSQRLIDEIKSYQGVANDIIAATTTGAFKNRSYNDLADFVDKFGSRLFGTPNLESAIDYMLSKMLQDGLENVHGENATIPRWVRGEESATLLFPRKKKLALLGLGFSVGTPPKGITAEVLVVKSFCELHKRAKEAKGKIIVYNEKYISYGETVEYRSKGASEAAKVGAVASLIRSVTSYSQYTPHTGQQEYEANVTAIPTACITVEDANFLARIQSRGQKIVIELKMNDYNLPLTTSRNVIGEIIGKEKPDEVVVVSGHIDSWDVGYGAMDDGGGMMISAEALALLQFLKLRPRRTLRAILWTAEEPGLWGVQNYIEHHKNEMDKFNAVFESDIGTFRPLGLDFSGNDQAGCIVQQVLQLLAPLNATTFRQLPSVGSDIGYFIDKGVNGLSLNNDNSKYFYYHHSEADTMDVINSESIDQCNAVWAVSAYVLADLSVSLPRNEVK